MTVIESIDRTLLGGKGISPSHVKPFLDKMDAVIAQVNLGSAASAQLDDYIRSDVDFSQIGATSYLEMFTVTGVVGTGTNVITGNKAVLTTGTSANDYESTLSNLAKFARGDVARFKGSVNNVADVEITFGLYQGATKYFIVSLKTGTGSTLYAELNDGSGAQTMDLEITPVNDVENDITVYTDSDGTPHVVVDGTEIDISGTITKKVATDLHKARFDVKTLTTAARVLSMSWLKERRTA